MVHPPPGEGNLGTKSTDVRDREHGSDGAQDGSIRINGGDMANDARPPPRQEIPMSCSTGAGEQMAKPTPSYFPVKPQLRAKR